MKISIYQIDAFTYELFRGNPAAACPALAMDLLTTELICDGHHLHPAVITIVMRCKPRDKIALVSDPGAALGLPEGNHGFLGIPVLNHNMGAVSTVTGAVLINSVMIMVAEKMLTEGIEPLVLPSGSVDSADFMRIQGAIQKYIGRINYL